MAGALLDRIINETIHRSFKGANIFNSSLHNTSDNGQNEDIALISSSLENQLDSLTMQSIEMGQVERLFWVLVFTIMVVVAAGGNTIVVYIVSTNKEMKSVTNYFLVNLSLADTMVSTLNVVFNFISMLNRAFTWLSRESLANRKLPHYHHNNVGHIQRPFSHWPFGKIYCKISNFIAILSISASVFTLTAISCDRYNAILHPLRPRMSHSHAIGWILLIWTLSSLLAMPNAIYSTLVEDRLANDNIAITCTMIWPDGRYPLSSYDHIYNIVILVVTYLVPILTMAILYYKVGKELWGYEAIGENVDKQQRAIMAKKKIVKMMIVVVIIFALCWLPYHAFFIVNYYVPTIFQDVPLHYQRCYLIMYWLAMSNSMYNPIIIYFMNSKFRHEFKKILSFLCLCRTYSPPANGSSISDNQHTRTNTQIRRRSTIHNQSVGTTNLELDNQDDELDKTKVAQEQSKEDYIEGRKRLFKATTNNNNNNNTHDNLKSLVDQKIDELDEEDEPFLIRNTSEINNSKCLDTKGTQDKLIDFANINSSKKGDSTCYGKVWI